MMYQSYSFLFLLCPSSCFFLIVLLFFPRRFDIWSVMFLSSSWVCDLHSSSSHFDHNGIGYAVAWIWMALSFLCILLALNNPFSSSFI
ncbi:hypothetical protein BDV25DRAFT_161229 [Aspergillus avenaceus]|uniref:Uncharacterized protein n=1 Tax=Aspergillus avenaceus TaxID=36643 RepID=A0A5N6TLN6_ASPAV|nr:hypothetical protein BDV25DRAFT_161229 [Aspergillus avenaceus]